MAVQTESKPEDQGAALPQASPVSLVAVAKRGLRAVLPEVTFRSLAQQKRRLSLGQVRWGSFNRVTPISRIWGHDRGQPIDRYYIEGFLKKHAADIKGRVLEVGDPRYTKQFGGDRVTCSDILHALPGNPEATFVGDIAEGAGIPDDRFNCLIFTQVLHCCFDPKAALRHLYRILEPGGVALLTLPGIMKVDWGAMEHWPDYWRFTCRSAQRLFEETFGAGNVEVETFGNVRAALGFLHGLAQEDMRASDLDAHDPHYEVTIAVRAVKTPA